MDELQRRALARLPLSADEMRFTYTLARRSEVWKVVCESHERLRAELNGTTVLLTGLRAELDAAADLLRDAEAENARLSAEMLRLRGVLERISAGVRFSADVAAEALYGGDDDGTA